MICGLISLVDKSAISKSSRPTQSGTVTHFLKMWNSSIICEIVSYKFGTAPQSGTNAESGSSTLYTTVRYDLNTLLWFKIMIYMPVYPLRCDMLLKLVERCFKTWNSMLFETCSSIFLVPVPLFEELFHFLSVFSDIAEKSPPNCGLISLFIVEKSSPNLWNNLPPRRHYLYRKIAKISHSN